MAEPGRVLLIEPDAAALRNLEHVLGREGYAIASTRSGAEALHWLEAHEAEVALRGIGPDPAEAQSWLQQCRGLQPNLEVVFLIHPEEVAGLARITGQGHCLFLEKPWKLASLRTVVSEALGRSQKERRLALDGEVAGPGGEKYRLVTRDPAMEALLAQARKLAVADLPVLITGETGTGKELLARLIHATSARGSGPFVAINCGALSEELVGNELFGHVRGAFTGATHNKPGLVEMANRGTLFLDEIGEMPPTMQVKLLRVIQEKEVMRVGALQPTAVDVRVIAATNRSIQEEIAAGNFRKDLYFRLNVCHLHLPPLRERRGDVALLARHFLRHFPPVPNPKAVALSPDTLAILEGHPFPGNVRELKNLLQRAMALGEGPEITPADLPVDLVGASPPLFQPREGRFLTLDEMEQEYLLWICRQVGENHTLAAQLLGIDRVSLWRRLKKIRREVNEGPAPGVPTSTIPQ
ncbi:MAG: sigma-54-dependent Fis family transcriptional regulator [Magnetococcales bacterium]|nr:sigma-54-dependent Fis family transcriptional regulator [Magnetococcales bacterium]